MPSGSESDNKFWQWIQIRMEQVSKELQPDSSQPITHTCIAEVMGCHTGCVNVERRYSSQDFLMKQPERNEFYQNLSCPLHVLFVFDEV